MRCRCVSNKERGRERERERGLPSEGEHSIKFSCHNVEIIFCRLIKLKKRRNRETDNLREREREEMNKTINHVDKSIN